MKRLSPLFIATAILLAGFAARIALYDYHGLEGDDGFSVALSRTPVETLIPGVIRLELDIHPPLHVLALKGWIALSGDSLLALRLMNILADLLTAALVLRLAGRAFGARAGLTAGALWVFAPLLHQVIWLVRMYSLLALFTTAGAVCAQEILLNGRRIGYAGLLLAALAALYTHITGAVAVGAFGAALAVGWLIRRGASFRRVIVGWLMLALAGILYLPFAWSALSVYRSGRTLGTAYNTSSFAQFSDVPGTITLTALLHRLSSIYTGVWQLVAVGLLLGATVWLVWRGRARRALVPLALLWVALIGMMTLAWFFDIYRPRYLALATPLVLAALAGMIQPLRWRAARAALLVTLIGLSLHAVRLDLDRTTRDDFAAAAAFIGAHERPGDTIVIIPDWGQDAFRFHYDGALPVVGIFPRLSAEVDYAPILDSLTAGYERVWLVRYQPEVSDPDSLALDWFRGRAAALTEVFPPGMRVLYFDFAPLRAALPPDARPLDATFSDVARLHGVYLPVTTGSARDTRLHPPSNWVQVILYWESLRPGVDFVPRVRFTDSLAQVWGAALEIEGGVLARHPVTTWGAGELVGVAYNLNLNPATPPGTYNIEVMALDPTTGAPLESSGADAGDSWVIAGQFAVME